MSARLIKQAVKEVKKVENNFTVGDKVLFEVWVPLQNIGMTTETMSGTVIKVNKVTIDVETAVGNVYRADIRDKSTRLV